MFDVTGRGPARGVPARLVIAWIVGALLLLTAADVARAGEQGSPASLRITVQDQTDSALVNATVAIVDSAGTERQVVTDGRGVAVFADLTPGTYQIAVNAEGFRTFTGTATVKRGLNQTTAHLAVALEEAIVVQDENIDSRRDNGFTQTLTKEEIDALSDDPDEMADQLAQMAGGNAQIFVDGFGGGRLPPKDQIQSIRISTNSYSAQYHDAGMVRIDVITKPGMGGWRGNLNFGFRDESLNARNAFAPVRGPEQQKRFMFGFSGPIAQGKTSLSIRADGNTQYDSKTILAQTATGQVNDQVRRPADNMNVNVRIDQALGVGHQLQAEYFRQNNTRDNLGVGDFDLPERAYSTDSVTDTLRLRNTRVIGKSAFSELKVTFSNTESSQSSLTDTPAVQVLDSFTSGGAGLAGTRRGKQFQIEETFDFTIAKHTFRAGALLESGWWKSDQQSNVNGSFTFSSLDDYLLGLARTYSIREGDPLVSYSQHEVGWFLQDDFKLRKNLSVSLGLRQEVQTNYDDTWNLAPRAAVTWTVAKTNIRGGWGVFYDWFDSSLYEQTLRLNGAQQVETIIVNPSYPNVDTSVGTTLPPSRIQRADHLTQPTVQQASIGFDRQLTPLVGLRADYMWTRGTHTLRSVNVNAPDENGIRPDPTAGNISEIRSDGRRASDRVTVGVNFRAPAASFFGTVMYNWSNTRNFADSPTSLPSDSNNPDADWGPSAQDVRHRLFILANAPLIYGVRAGLNVQASSALPYNITTGTDDNGDTVFNDRPDGISRNSARGASLWNVGLRLNRTFSLGGIGGGPMGPTPIGAGGPPPAAAAQQGPGGPGPRGPGGEGGGPQMMIMQNSNARYRLDLYLQVFNLLNTTNLNTFVGNLLSPYYGQATSAASARRLEIGATLFF